MKITFIHTDDKNDKNLWSGTVYYIYQTLTRKFDEVMFYRPTGNNSLILKFFFGGIGYISRKITGNQSLNLYSSYFLPKSLSKSVDNFVKRNPVDCIISTTNTPFLFTKSKVPLVIITDATVKLLYNEHAESKGWSKLFYKVLEKNALKVTNKATLIVSSSKSTTNSLISDYNIYPAKIATIPFGANIEDDKIQPRQRMIKRNNTVNFLFVGKDWERKGGSFTISVCDELIRQKTDVQLIVVGCKVPEESQRTYLKNYIYLDKNKEDEFDQLRELYRAAHFFMVFSRAEMYGIVFCEAAAFGLPVVAFAVGGIVDIVINNKTGIILPKDSNAKDFALKISELISDPDKYHEMSENARNRYEELLNWDVFTTSLKNEIYKRVKLGVHKIIID